MQIYILNEHSLINNNMSDENSNIPENPSIGPFSNPGIGDLIKGNNSLPIYQTPPPPPPPPSQPPAQTPPPTTQSNE